MNNITIKICDFDNHKLSDLITDLKKYAKSEDISIDVNDSASRGSRTLSAVPSEDEIYTEARVFENYKSDKFETPEAYESSGRFCGFVKGAEWAIQKLTKRGIVA